MLNSPKFTRAAHARLIPGESGHADNSAAISPQIREKPEKISFLFWNLCHNEIVV